ncbi:MAG TPA: hypothetical protein VNM43_07920 [Dehalococcoidia bacterium]|nr:hypothetical protein [Dehalococcoidia bacterium]
MLPPMRILPVAVLGALGALAVAGCREGVPSYDVTVAFNDRYTEAALQETDAILRSYDDDIDVLVQESFPPVARTVIQSSMENLCEDLRSQLERKPYIEQVDCEERL